MNASGLHPIFKSSHIPVNFSYRYRNADLPKQDLNKKGFHIGDGTERQEADLGEGSGCTSFLKKEIKYDYFIISIIAIHLNVLTATQFHL